MDLVKFDVELIQDLKEIEETYSYEKYYQEEIDRKIKFIKIE